MTRTEHEPPVPEASWLVHQADDPPAPVDLRVWLPAALTQHAPFDGDEAAEAASQLSYVVVDEIVDDAIGLTITAWPYADEEGRLRFLGEDRRLHVGVGRAELQAHLYGSEGRTPRIGDVFGAELRPEWNRADATSDEPSWVEGPDEVFQGAVYDLTQAARTVSKLAYYGAVTSVLSSSQAAADNLLDLEQPPEHRAPKRQLPPAGDESSGREDGR